tara:strand:- start:550 stop:897 length:348 start_codon:yes stop_codon:yes gene_type:complete
MANRNDYKNIIDNNSVLRETVHGRRNVDIVKILERLPYFYPNEEELRDEINHDKEIYKTGDRLYKFALKHYGDVDLWWVIAWYNNKPTDAHFKIGDVVYIPRELDVALRIATREI